VDYGNVWEVGKTLTRDGEGEAYGLGLRYSLLSIFNVRVDVATDGPEFHNWQWVLDLAQAF
jgi:hemolysin activation/secretion protein